LANLTQKYVSLLKIFEIIKNFKVSSDDDFESSKSGSEDEEDEKKTNIQPNLNKKQVPFSNYLNIENKENKTTISYDKSFKKLLEKKNRDFMNRLNKKKNVFILNKGSDWDIILLNRLMLSDMNKEIENLKKIIEKEYENLNSLSDPELFVGELKYIKEKANKEIIEKIAKKIKYIRRLEAETDNFTSFYTTVGYGYLEQIMTESSPFNSLLKLLQKITNKNFVLINPFSQNLEKSYSGNFEVAIDYVIDILINFSQNMFIEWEKKKNMKEFRLLMMKKLENLMKTEKMFRLMAIMLVKSLVCEESILKELSSEIQDNLLNGKNALEFQNIEYVCDALNIKIKIYGYTVETKKGEKHFNKIYKVFGRKLEQDCSTIILYYEDGLFSLAHNDL